MTTPNNFDRVLQAWLGEAAPSSAPAGLHARDDRPRAAAAASASHGRSPLRDALAVRPSGRVSLVVRIAAVTILTLLVGIAFLTGIGRQPTPPLPVPVPAPTSSPTSVTAPSPAPSFWRGFLRPFAFVLPAGEEVDVQPTNSHMFRISGPGGRDAGHGVSVVIVDAPRGHACGENGGTLIGGTSIRDTRAEFLADFETRLGVALTDPAPTVLDGNPSSPG